jgi:DNA-directed RNA polymerase subunit RPC12/RpoP
MARYDFAFICRDCGHAFTISADEPVKDSRIKCASCGSRNVHQRFWNYLRQGPAAASQCKTSYG